MANWVVVVPTVEPVGHTLAAAPVSSPIFTVRLHPASDAGGRFHGQCRNRQQSVDLFGVG
eukprot:1353671-Amphidinium_carterae.2